MLDYAKKVLEKVAFDLTIFKKEFIKFYTSLNAEQVILLIDWCTVQFSEQHQLVIIEARAGVRS